MKKYLFAGLLILLMASYAMADTVVSGGGGSGSGTVGPGTAGKVAVFGTGGTTVQDASNVLDTAFTSGAIPKGTGTFLTDSSVNIDSSGNVNNAAGGFTGTCNPASSVIASACMSNMAQQTVDITCVAGAPGNFYDPSGNFVYCDNLGNRRYMTPIILNVSGNYSLNTTEAGAKLAAPGFVINVTTTTDASVNVVGPSENHGVIVAFASDVSKNVGISSSTANIYINDASGNLVGPYTNIYFAESRAGMTIAMVSQYFGSTLKWVAKQVATVDGKLLAGS